jgi:ribosome recycling factor
MSGRTTVDDVKKKELAEESDRRMKSAIEVLHKELTGLRTGRASVSFLEPVIVDAYGTSMPITQVATLGTPEPRLITVQVWDKSLVKAVEKAITEAGLGLNPAADGQTVRVPIPSLTEERRVELTKVAGKYAEEARVSIRNVRRHAMDELKKAEKTSDISQDEQRDMARDLQDLTDAHIKEVGEVLQRKETEIMQV